MPLWDTKYAVDPSVIKEVQAYIEAYYREEKPKAMRSIAAQPEEMDCLCVSMPCVAADASLDDALETLDESFSQMVLRKIDEKGLTDPQCYKKAHLDRKLFSKIRTDIHYRPAKQTALSIALALELPLDEVRELLEKAGFALSHSSKADVIVEYFIRQGTYDIMEINAVLYHYDQPLLGGRM